MEKCVRRTVVLSGPRSKAANGRLSCKVVAVFCRSRQAVMAASICPLLSGFRAGYFEGVAVTGSGTEVETGWVEELADDAGVNWAFEYEEGVTFLVTLL